MRDQILILRPVVEKTTAPILSKALEYCCANKIASAADFKAVVLQMSRPEIETPDDKTLQMNPLNGTSPDISLTHVEQSSIEVYQKFMQN